jgi:hypothetical protein
LLTRLEDRMPSIVAIMSLSGFVALAPEATD